MMLIADGGSTKTDWRVLKEGCEYKQVQTTGFNPYLVGTEEIESILWKELQPYIDNTRISSIYYYGAGCSTATKNEVVEEAFRRVFPAAAISIHHDLFGASKALCGNNEGIVAILGTGSNSCFFDGKNITDHIFSLGYFFGDEGSGACMGKRLISDYLHTNLPADLANMLQTEFPMSKESILDAVYNKPGPNRFLASFSAFIGRNRSHPYLYDLIRDNFRQFYRYQVLCYTRYKEVPVSFVGSVAFHFEQELKETGSEFGITVGKIIKAPIDGLVEYHLSEV